ncbi:hypothetical protein GSI_09099 [Ganoderma sinense ZZ0214-1]|uniref:Uncharacterized protein n=1 Tax=Ganoderma sinense ZZ0214-1 TaxID=1077348 RepID=A0A2G8S5L2_9APHY|nr:hypothetical protein GSI_09099 [Ganoderma sinense ZZ0214-1]
MPSALSSPSGRIRSRTSDISDFLRGRHDAKASMDTPSRLPPPSQIPAIPRLSPSAAELVPVTPPKSKHKFSFLARKRKQSLSPSSAKTDASSASLAAVAVATPVHANTNSAAIGARRETDHKQVPPVPVVASHDREGGNQPMGAG